MMLGGIVFLTIFGFSFGAPPAGKPSQRIKYGEDTADNSVLLLEHSGYQCTATLIAPQIILTAAHCLWNNGARTTVIHGCSDLDSASCEEMEVTSYIIHPEYICPGMVGLGIRTNDIAVAKLASPLEDVRPKSLADIYEDDPPRGLATLVGWGETETEEAPRILQSISLPITDELDDIASEEKIVVDHNNAPGRITCGDSGGPLMIGDTIYGIASTTSCMAMTNGIHIIMKHYGIYMSVQYYSNFIHNSIKKLEGN